MGQISDIAAADAWLAEAFPNVSRETWQRLAEYEQLVIAEGQQQNLISRATFDTIRLRHIVDSAQLLTHVPEERSRWLDLGSGAGFPGLVVATLSNHDVSLVESRRLRIDFLERAVRTLGIGERATIIGSPLERVPDSAYDVISARAFAPLPRLLELAHRFSTEKTIWVLPKGRSAQTELEQALGAWQGDFRLEPSLTDPEARIIVATGVRPRGKRRELK